MTTNFKPWGAPFRKAVQRELQSRGVYNGAVNGVFGNDTLAALRSLPGRGG
jgi:peptidoglycan hydrolase-like protein with peptidoglycan-binding domain